MYVLVYLVHRCVCVIVLWVSKEYFSYTKLLAFERKDITIQSYGTNHY